MIKPAFLAALMPGVRLPPLTALRGRAAVIPTVGLPPVAGPTEGEHRPAPRAAAPHRAPRHGSGHRPGTPRRLRRVRRRRGVTGETDRPAWADGGARPGVRRSRTHGSRPLRDRTPSRTLGTRSCRCENLGARGRGVRPRRPAPTVPGRALVRARPRCVRAWRRRYQRSVARPRNPLSVPSSIGLSRRWASTPSSRFRRSRSSTPRP